MKNIDAQYFSRQNSKKRSSKIILFLIHAPLFLYHSLAVKDYWGLLFASCFALYAPILWLPFNLFLCFKIHTQFVKNLDTERENIQSTLIHFLERNHLQKIKEIIESNPEILYCDYQRRSLIAWCRYYKNSNAQALIMQMMEKYPKAAIAA